MLAILRAAGGDDLTRQTIVAALTLLVGGLAGGSAGPGRTAVAADVQEPACRSSSYRQFDFWLGEWQVSRASDGEPVGTNRITRILDGCVIREEYSSRSGYAGTSYNIYDGTTGRWHQTWVDNTGLLLQLDGGLEGDRMVLSGSRVDREGRPVLDRISWTPVEEGRVRQVWEVSRDDGASWRTIFDGLYAPESGAG